MMRNNDGTSVYLVRHCRAEGVGPDAVLSEEGARQAEALAEWFAGQGVHVRRIVSSPLARAVQSATPLARWAGVSVETDARLRERLFSPTPVPDWRERTAASFADPDLCLPGGESSRQASDRACAALEDALEHGERGSGVTVLVTHGQPLAQLLDRLGLEFGFEDWLGMTNPDVYHLRFAADGRTGRPERVWSGAS
jgi:2,3-bisphosphoglycerate-dependent phosphoglycerate mutase